jgi:hypothetical protein
MLNELYFLNVPSMPLVHLLPRNCHTLLMRLSCQLDDPQHISDLRGLDPQFSFAIDSIRYILIQPHPMASDGRILPHVPLAPFVKCLYAFVKLFIRREHTAKRIRLSRKIRIKRFRALGNLLFLWTSAPFLVLQERTRGAADPELELLRHRGYDACLHCDQQVFLRPIVLQNDSERVLDLAFDAALDAEECCDGLWAPKEHVGLIEAVGSETEGVTIARGVVFALHVVQPRGAVEVVVNFCFVDVAECFLLHELLHRQEIAILES